MTNLNIGTTVTSNRLRFKGNRRLVGYRTACGSKGTGDWLDPESTWTPLSELELWFLCHPGRSLIAVLGVEI